jgi:hypothetical protein
MTKAKKERIAMKLKTIGAAVVGAAAVWCGTIWGLNKSNDLYWAHYRAHAPPDPPSRDPGPTDFVDWYTVRLPDGRILNQHGWKTLNQPATTRAQCEREHYELFGKSPVGNVYADKSVIPNPGPYDWAIVLRWWCAPLGDGRPWWPKP